MTDAETISLQGGRTSRGNRILLFVEALIFVLPCYLIYVACLPWAAVAVGIIPSAIGEILSNKGAAFALNDVAGILPYMILGVTACLGVRPLWRAARLIFRVLGGSPVGAAEATMLAKTLRLALVPLVVMVLSGIGSMIPSLSHGSSWAIRTWQDAIFGLYLSGLPLLVPAIHMRRIFAATGP
jgi:hypothetical protein